MEIRRSGNFGIIDTGTDKGLISFSIKFRKWNRQTRDGGDMVILTAARLRKKATDESIENSSYKLFLTDTTTGRPLNCWECLVMEFNGKRITI